MALRRRDWFWLALMAAVVIWGGQVFDHVEAAAQDAYGKIGQTADDRYGVETALLRYYVEEIDPVKLQLAEIGGMMRELDIYSDFLNEKEQEDLRMTTEGAFGGLGIEINTVDHYPTVISPLEGTPAWEVGLQSGDQIIEIEGVPTHDEKLDIIVSKLRGAPGTPVNIKVKRPGVANSIDFRIVRAEIHVYSVYFHGPVWDGDAPGALPADVPDWVKEGGRIGYIRLSSFSRGAAEEVQAALEEFRARRVEGVILDMRMNPGGLLEEARAVADLFLPKGQLIVSTKGRNPHSEQRLYSERDPVIPPSVPLAVLVDEQSASASEIVAGAIQDNDRGLIIGRPTFGKGSVQTVYNTEFGPRYGLDLSSGALLKLTTAYYYSPSGRCIHKPRWRDGDRGAVASKSAGDTSTVYHTLRGREVRGGGGVAVDVNVGPDIPPPLYWQLRARRLFFHYASEFVAGHPELSPHTFRVTDEIVEGFRAFVTDTARAFTYEPQGTKELAALEKVVRDAGYAEGVLAQMRGLKDSLGAQQTREFERADPYIRDDLRSSIAGRAWGRQARVRATFGRDMALKEAVSYLRDGGRYAHQTAVSPQVIREDRDQQTDEQTEPPAHE